MGTRGPASWGIHVLVSFSVAFALMVIVGGSVIAHTMRMRRRRIWKSVFESTSVSQTHPLADIPLPMDPSRTCRNVPSDAVQAYAESNVVQAARVAGDVRWSTANLCRMHSILTSPTTNTMWSHASAVRKLEDLVTMIALQAKREKRVARVLELGAWRGGLTLSMAVAVSRSRAARKLLRYVEFIAVDTYDGTRPSVQHSHATEKEVVGLLPQAAFATAEDRDRLAARMRTVVPRARFHAVSQDAEDYILRNCPRGSVDLCIVDLWTVHATMRAVRAVHVTDCMRGWADVLEGRERTVWQSLLVAEGLALHPLLRAGSDPWTEGMVSMKQGAAPLDPASWRGALGAMQL